MTHDKFIQTLESCNADTSLAKLVSTNTNIPYRNRLNSMLNLRLLRLGISLEIREYLEVDGSDSEWIRLFKKYIINHLYI